MKRSWLWLLGGAAILAGAGVPFALGGRDVLATLATIPLGAVAGLGGLALASALARAVKLRLLAMRLGHHITVPRALITAFASDAAFQATPAGAGGYPATILLLRRGGVPASAGVAMCAADQALDSALFAVALPLFCLLDLGDAVPAAWHSIAWLPAAVMTAIAGVKVLVVNALFRTAHPTHLSIPDAIRVAERVGAERTYLTHLTHENFHADLETELPRGISPAFDGLTVRID